MGLFNHEAANRALEASDVPVQNAIRRIYLRGAASNAPVYQDPDLTIMRVSDMKSDASGYFDLCYVQDGEYRVEIESPQGDILYSADNVFVGSHLRTQELDEYNSTDQLRDDVFLSYQAATGRYPVRPGQKILICSTDIQYKVMPADESAPQLVSGGGVKFCQTGTRYTDLNCFVHAVARGENFSVGTTVFVGGAVYAFDDDGNTDLPGLTGWRRVVSPDNDADLTQSKAKTDLLTVSQSVNLDVIPALVAESSTYDSLPNGLAGTSDGETFFVATGPGLQVYRNDTGAGTFLGWHGDVLFDDVAGLSATTDLLPEGVIVRTRQEGYAYKVAGADASDHHLTTAGGVKLYVMANSGEYWAEAFGVKTDGTDQSQPMQAFLDAIMATGHGGVLPSGTIYISGLVRTDVGNAVDDALAVDLKWRSAGRTTLHLAAGSGKKLLLHVTTKAQTQLASDAAWKDRQIEVSDGSGISEGDLIHISCATVPSPSRPYQKQCLRRVTGVSVGAGSGGADVIYLDQPLVWFFNTSETVSVTCYPPIKILWDDISIKAEDQSGVSFRGFSDGIIRNMDITGPVKFYDSWTDPVSLTYCDNVTLDGGMYRLFRYLAIAGGSRRCKIRNFSAWGVRHIDPQVWAEDTEIGPGQGLWTQGLIQCHASINTIFRGIRDNIDIDSPELFGTDVRCVGGVVEDCEVSVNHSAAPGTNTNGIDMEADYQYLYDAYDRRITRLNNPHWLASARYVRTLRIEDCKLAGIYQAGYDVEQVIVDNRTEIENEVHQILTPEHIADGSVKALEPFSSYGRATGVSVGVITGATQGNPCVVTETGHGRTTGDVVRIDGIVGMTNLNERVFTITVTDSDSYALDGEDATGHTAYSSGGRATEQRSYETLCSARNPALGWSPKRHYQATMLENETLSGTSRTIPLKLHHDVQTPYRSYAHGQLRVKVGTRDSYTEVAFNYQRYAGHTSRIKFSSGTAIGNNVNGTLSVTVSNAEPHFYTEVNEEGGHPIADGMEYYATLDINIATDNGETLRRVDVEVEEYR